MRTLRSSPLIKTDFMNVISARPSTPDNILLVGFELHKADGAVAFDGLALAGGVLFGFGFAAERGSIVDFDEFLYKDCNQFGCSLFCLLFEGAFTVDKNASWYWRCAGALRALFKT